MFLLDRKDLTPLRVFTPLLEILAKLLIWICTGHLIRKKWKYQNVQLISLYSGNYHIFNIPGLWITLVLVFYYNILYFKTDLIRKKIISTISHIRKTTMFSFWKNNGKDFNFCGNITFFVSYIIKQDYKGLFLLIRYHFLPLKHYTILKTKLTFKIWQGY